MKGCQGSCGVLDLSSPPFQLLFTIRVGEIQQTDGICKKLLQLSKVILIKTETKPTFRRKVNFVGVEVFEESSVDRVRKLVDFYQVLATLLPMVLKH